MALIDKLKVGGERVTYELLDETLYFPNSISLEQFEDAFAGNDTFVVVASKLLVETAQNEDGSLAFEGITPEEVRKFDRKHLQPLLLFESTNETLIKNEKDSKNQLSG